MINKLFDFLFRAIIDLYDMVELFFKGNKNKINLCQKMKEKLKQ